MGIGFRMSNVWDRAVSPGTSLGMFRAGVLAFGLFLSLASAVRGAALPEDWSAAWETVSRSRDAGRFQEAITQTLELERRAVSRNAWDQVARAVLERFSLENAANPQSRDRQLMVLDRFTRQAPDVIRPVLACALAHFYWETFLENPARYSGRSRLADPAAEGENPAHWSFPRLKQAIDEQIAMALDDAARLKRIPVERYEGLLCEGTLSDRYRPTLFDLVAHDALEVWRTVHTVNGKWDDDPFTWSSDGPACEDTDRFIEAIPPDAGTESHLLKSLQLYRELLQFHKNDKDKTAFAAADLDRLTFCFEHTQGDDVREKYIGALDLFIVRWRQSPISARAAAIRARLAYEDGQPGIAHLIASRGASGFSESEVGVRQCRAWIRRIEQSSFSLSVESVWCEPWPSFKVTYKNIRELYFRAVLLSGKEMLAQLELSEPERLADWLSRRAVKMWSIPLPPCKDFKERQYDFPVPSKLPRGHYVLLVSDKPDFSEQTGTVLAQEIQVSRLALALTEQDGILRGGTVLDANSGSPITGAAVQLWAPRGQTSRVYTCKHVFKTDADGRFFIDGSNKDLRLCVLSGRDSLWTPRSYRQGHFSEKFAPLHEAYLLLTDKPAYSPGQTVRFAGVAFAADRQNATYFPLKNNQVKVALKSPGHPVPFAEQVLVSDSFGNFSGSFVLPETVPLGTAQLVAGSHALSFQVERYRIPAFEIHLADPPPTARLNALVTIDGMALTRSGEALAGASVNWSVSRTGLLPPWSALSGKPCPGDGEIANGRHTVAPDGTFSISFFTQADKKIPADESPAFDFLLRVEVRDISGETHLAQTRLQLGHAAWKAEFQCDPWQTTRKPVGIRLALRTLRDEPVSQTGTLRIYPLKQPAALRRPSQTGAEGYPLAPNLLDQWETEDELVSEMIATGTNGLAIGRVTLPAGAYRLVFEAKDTADKPVTAKQTLVVLDPEKSQLKMNIPEWFRIEKTTLNPGEKLRAYWGTGYPSGVMRLEILQGSRVWCSERIGGKRTQQFFEFPITEAMRGGLTLRTLFVRENRIYTHTERIEVPWTNKRLDLHWEHHALQTDAGRKTIWRAVATLPEGEPVPTGWIATLYDRSLDEVAEPNWPDAGFRREFRQEAYDTYAVSFVNANRILSPSALQPEIAPDEQFPWIPKTLLRVATPTPVSTGPENGYTYPFLSPSVPDTPLSAVGNLPVFRANTHAASCFMAGLTGDAEGKVAFDFTTPPETSVWRFRAFAYDADLRSGTLCADLTTHRMFDVAVDLPGHLHEEDMWRLVVRLARNPTEENAKGPVTVSARFHPIDRSGKRGPSLALAQPVRTVELAPDGTCVCEWQIQIPRDILSLNYRLEVSSPGFTDCREGDIPVSPQNRDEVVCHPIIPVGGSSRDIVLESLGDNPATRLTLRMVGDPLGLVPYALSAMTRTEDAFPEGRIQRLAARVIGRRLRESRPDLLAMAPLLAGDGSSDTAVEEAVRELGERQLPTGGWPWIPGSPQNDTFTLAVLETVADLFEWGLDPKTIPWLAASVEALDRRIAETRVGESVPSDILPLYVRMRLAAACPLPSAARDRLRDALDQAVASAADRPIADQARLAIALALGDRRDVARTLAEPLRDAVRAESAHPSGDPGRTDGAWSGNPTVRLALLWRCFRLTLDDPRLDRDCRNALLARNRLGDWGDPAANLHAALALAGYAAPKADIGKLAILVGERTLQPPADAVVLGFWQTDPVTGKIPPAWRNLTVTDQGTGDAWCGLYVSTPSPVKALPVSETAPLGIRKAYFIRRHTARGSELRPVKGDIPIGSELVCRLEIRADRTFESVQLQDDYPACAEPVHRYPFAGRQGDLSFFAVPDPCRFTFLIERLPRGMHLLEYTCRIRHAGQFWSGVAELACRYAPEIAATSNETTLTVTP